MGNDPYNGGGTHLPDITVTQPVFVGEKLIGWVANRINPGLAHYAEIIDVLSTKLPAPLIGELPYLPRAEQRELSRYVDLDMLGNVMAIDRIPA